MMEPILKGLLLGLILSISIGPVIFAILKQSLTNGHKAGYAFVVGVSASDITLLIICNVFTALFTLVLSHKAMVAMIGSGFLLIMGLYTLLFKKIKVESLSDDNQKDLGKRAILGIFFSGYLMNTLNPSVFLFWFAWTAAIGSNATESENPTTYKIIVFGTCLLFVLASDLTKVFLAGALRPKLTEKNLIWINRISGILLLIFSVALFYSALKY